MRLKQAVERKLKVQVKDIAELSNNVEVFEEALSSRFHLYICPPCNMRFAIDQNFEDQSIIVCPSCRIDDYIQDNGEIDINNINYPF